MTGPEMNEGGAADLENEHDAGLQADLRQLMSRRRALALVGGTGAAGLLAGCGDGPVLGRAEPEVVAVDAKGAQCVAHPTETEGPYPGDGSNRAHGELANVLDDSGVMREDLRSDIGAGPESAAPGVPLNLRLRLVDVGRGCAPLAGYALYLWHCDAEGRYSIYNLPDRSYLRGVGVADTDGEVRFRTIFPGCYRGRYPHCHFEVYPSLAAARDYRNKVLTSQLAMPAEASAAVYKLGAYAGAAAAFKAVSLKRDGVFGNNTPRQLSAQTPTLTGDPESGYEGRVTIGLSA